MCARNILFVSALLLRITGSAARACPLLCVSNGVFVLLKNFCGPLLVEFERFCQVLAFMRRIMQIFLSITFLCQFTLFVETDSVKCNVSGCHFDTCTHLPVRVLFLQWISAVNADIFSATSATISKREIYGWNESEVDLVRSPNSQTACVARMSQYRRLCLLGLFELAHAQFLQQKRKCAALLWLHDTCQC